MYEDRRTPPLPPRRFARRMANHVAVAAGLIALSLLVGMWGYEHYEHLLWRDAFLNTAMLLGGMGPVDPLLCSGATGPIPPSSTAARKNALRRGCGAWCRRCHARSSRAPPGLAARVAVAAPVSAA